MSTSPEWSNFLKFASNAAVVVVGWWIVHVLSARRDRDKSRRELVAKSCDALISDLSALMLHARSYHLGSRDVALENTIKMSIQDIAQSISSLRDVVSNQQLLAPCQAAVRGVRGAVTGSHFEDEHDGPRQENDSLLQQMAFEILRAKRALSNLKHRQFI